MEFFKCKNWLNDPVIKVLNIKHPCTGFALWNALLQECNGGEGNKASVNRDNFVELMQFLFRIRDEEILDILLFLELKKMLTLGDESINILIPRAL